MTEKDDHKTSVLQPVAAHRKKHSRHRLIYSGGGLAYSDGELIYASGYRPTKLFFSKQGKENLF